jgi:hypothetical protein
VHRGTVTATRIRSKEVTITTTFGDIFFSGELQAGGKYLLRSYKGNVSTRTGGPFAIDAHSRQGEVETGVKLGGLTREGGRVTGRWGAGGRPAILVLRSTMGRVMFGLANE